jgi:prepilin-type N-terminal cleavage/methylation domain-containing protein
MNETYELLIEARTRLLRGQNGYTLIEIVIVIVILGVIGGFTFQMVGAGVQAFKKSSARKDLCDQGRLALERMVRELRDAKEVTASSSDSITFKVAHPSEFSVVEEIRYQLNGSNVERVADPSGSATTAVLGSSVSGFTVTPEDIGGDGGGETGPCTIAFDNASKGATGGDYLSFAHAIGSGSNRLLVVCVAAEASAGATISNVTYNGTSLTRIASAVADVSAIGIAELWYLLDANLPAAGTYSVEIYASESCGDLMGGAISLTEVAQQASEASNTNTNVGPDTISTSITTLTDGAWIVDAVENGNPNSFTADSGQTQRVDQSGGSAYCAGSTKLIATAGSTSIQWSANANRLAHVVAAFAPATGCGGENGGTNLVMVTGDGAYSNGDDNAKKTLFESWGWTVTAINDGADQATFDSAAANNNVMFISESCNSSTVGTKPLGLDIGMVVEESWCWDELNFATSGDSSEWTDTITITDNSHYITSSFSTGNLTIYDSTEDIGSLPVSLASGGELLATENDTNSPTLFVFDTGSDLTSGTAANRRVGFPSSESDRFEWNANMETLLQRSLDWASANEVTGNVATLEITLQNPNDSGNTVTMRTKVFMRNVP